MENIYKPLICAGAILTALAGYMISVGANYSTYVFMSGLAIYILLIVLNLVEDSTSNEK